jgi:hypothetical protein
MLGFLVVTPRGLVGRYELSDKHIASIFTAVRTSNLKNINDMLSTDEVM